MKNIGYYLNQQIVLSSKSSESEGAYQSENPYRLEFWQAMAQFTAVSPQFVLRDTIFEC
jgi:hypothetical protein